MSWPNSLSLSFSKNSTELITLWFSFNTYEALLYRVSPSFSFDEIKSNLFTCDKSE